MYVGVTPTQSKKTHNTLVPAVKRDALIHKCLLRFAMVNEQSVEYWEAFQNARADQNKVIYL